uniref:Uncharacterized protein n=1 Tax=viral metagenome TaxID=1070528 RepID=A0A6M3J4N8_9ZZZZ
MKYITEAAIRRLIKYNGPCCDSCHDDIDDYAYSGCCINFGKNRVAEVCCALANAYDKWLTSRLT